ncbi:MAG: HAMP domain-containing sensor histidine kinase [Thermodesulfobacteriota bacterium]
MKPDSSPDKIHPAPTFLSWRANLTVFALLIAVVLSLFFYQLNRIHHSFEKQALKRSKMMVAIILENVENAVLTGEVIDKTIEIFLAASSEFASYLDDIRPFTEEELSAFSEKAGLAGVTVIRDDVPPLSAPAAWLKGSADCTPDNSERKITRHRNLATYTHHFEDDSGCLVVGLDATQIDQLSQRTGLEAQLDELSKLSDIHYIRIEEAPGDNQAEGVQLLDSSSQSVAETRLSTDLGTLVVGFDATYFSNRRTELRRQFLLFGIILCLLGASSSWLLKRYQTADIEKSREVEKMLARQHEEAALGRAAGAIAHEIRNPLNALDMGLQRLLIESDNLANDQRDLLSSMREATRRTDSIISRLKRYTQPLSPATEPIQLDTLLDKTITLYQDVARRRQVAISTNVESPLMVQGDPDLLGELIENLLKNSIESDSDHVNISLAKENSAAVLQLTNSASDLSDHALEQMMEPYFTTKTRGTGLGLSLCRRIADAHNGRISISRGPEPDSLAVTVRLPLDIKSRT